MGMSKNFDGNFQNEVIKALNDMKIEKREEIKNIEQDATDKKNEIGRIKAKSLIYEELHRKNPEDLSYLEEYDKLDKLWNKTANEFVLKNDYIENIGKNNNLIDTIDIILKRYKN